MCDGGKLCEMRYLIKPHLYEAFWAISSCLLRYSGCIVYNESMSVPRSSTLGLLSLTKEEAVLVSFMLSRDILEYRKSKYDGVRMHVEKCRDVRGKVKRVLKRYESFELK